MGNWGIEDIEGERLPADEERLGSERAMRALRWGLGFGVIGALALVVLILVSALFLEAMVKLTSEVIGLPSGDLDYWALARSTAIGPLTCIIVAGGLAWLIARSPGTTVPPWAVGLLTGVVGVLAGYGALHLTVL